MRKLTSLLALLLLMLTALPPGARAQSQRVTGTVRDDKGTPIVGATVTVLHSNISAETDATGAFTLPVPAGRQTLLISHVGMQSQEIPVKGATTGVIVLKAAAENLGDVVVVAYGTVKKKDLTGSVETLSGSDLLKGTPTNIVSGMQGKLAGVVVSQSDGAPGAGLNITVRGANSFIGTQPLYVVDGIPYIIGNDDATPSSVSGSEQSTVNALSFLNPNDIESITVLKDASATAIYGSRGANGVVIITTKKGKKGEDRVELDGSLAVSKVMREIKMLDAYGYASMQNEGVSNANYFEPGPTPRTLPYPGTLQQSPTNPDSMVYYPAPKDYIGKSNDWQKEIFHTGITNNYTLNVSGGSDKGNYLLSGSYLDQTGVIQDSRFKQMGIRANLTRNV